MRTIVFFCCFFCKLLTVLHLESDKAWVIMLNTCLPSCIHIMFIFGLKHIINVCFMTPVCSLHPWATSGPSFTHLVLLNLWSLVDSHTDTESLFLTLIDWQCGNTVESLIALRLLEENVCVYILYMWVCEICKAVTLPSHLFPQVKRAGCHPSKRKRKM